MNVPRNLLLVSLLAAASVLGGCGTPTIKQLENSGRPSLSADEIKMRLIGNSISAVGRDAVPFTVYFPVYGEMRGVHSNHYRDTGTWSISDGKFCGEWKNWWATDERCWKIYADGGSLYWIRPDGTTIEKVSIQRGNPKRL